MLTLGLLQILKASCGISQTKMHWSWLLLSCSKRAGHSPLACQGQRASHFGLAPSSGGTGTTKTSALLGSLQVLLSNSLIHFHYYIDTPVAAIPLPPFGLASVQSLSCFPVACPCPTNAFVVVPCITIALGLDSFQASARHIKVLKLFDTNFEKYSNKTP